jgi:hypothetical protein
MFMCYINYKKRPNFSNIYSLINTSLSTIVDTKFYEMTIKNMEFELRENLYQ